MRQPGIVNTNLMTGATKRLCTFIAFFVTAALGACSGGQTFSQFPGFSQHFSDYPPTATAPDSSQVMLLEKYKPGIYAAADQMGPVDFYRDYIAHGSLIINGRKLDQQPDAALLNQHREDPQALFKYEGDYKAAGTSVVYARIDYEKAKHKGTSYDFTFLTYNLVFPVSGILKGLGSIPSMGLAIAGNLNDWHQLDHYVNVSVALLDAEPIAMTLQQHNYQTTYLLDSASPDIAVDIAMRSNELYPHSAKEQKHPAVSFLGENNIDFLINNTNKPMMAGYDITHGEKEISYELLYLPQTDAFYQFKGSLGKNRLLPGRSGPPGSDYTTLPALMPRHLRLVAGYRPESAEKEIKLFKELFDRENFQIRPHAIEPYKDRFFKLLQER